MQTDTRWPFFWKRELVCSCGCGDADMDEKFMAKVVRARRLVPFKVPVTSGKRCRAHDLRVGSSLSPGGGPHALGRALDVNLWGWKLLVWILALMLVGIIRWPTWKRTRNGWGGLGLMQKGPMPKRYVHFDDLRQEEYQPRPWLWTY